MVDAYSVTNTVDRKDQVPAKPAEKVEERRFSAALREENVGLQWVRENYIFAEWQSKKLQAPAAERRNSLAQDVSPG